MESTKLPSSAFQLDKVKSGLTVMPAKSDSDVMFVYKVMSRSLVY